jgi:hypothetical protein
MTKTFQIKNPNIFFQTKVTLKSRFYSEYCAQTRMFLETHIQGGPISPKVFCQKISAISAHSAILGIPFVLGAYIAGSFLPNCVGFLLKNFGDFGKFGDIGPHLYCIYGKTKNFIMFSRDFEKLKNPKILPFDWSRNY